MRKLFFPLISILLVLLIMLAMAFTSCSKVSQSNLQGDWTVDSIRQQEITANTDSGWNSEKAISPIFFVGETLTISKSTIIPCPTTASMVKGYDNYPGYINYSLTGNKLVIPEQHYSYYRIDGNGDVSTGAINFRALEFEVGIAGNEMDLIGKFEETDNLGNVKKRVNVMIDLSRTK